QADPTHLTTLGVLSDSIFGSTAQLQQMGTSSPPPTDILIKYTYYGDTNLDGQVDGSDYARIDNGYIMGLSGWSNGDFNYDNQINGSDYTLIDNAFNTQGPRLISPPVLPIVPTGLAAQ